MVRLADQDRTRWDRALIAEGHDLVRACLRRNQPGRSRSRRPSPPSTPTPRPARPPTGRRSSPSTTSSTPSARTPSSPSTGPSPSPSSTDPTRGLAALDDIDADRLADYQPYHATRADLLARCGRAAEALAAYDRALELTTNLAEAAFLGEARTAAAAALRAGD